MRVFFTIAVVIVVLIVIGVAMIYSGAYNVAADHPDKGLIRWVFSTTSDESVDRRAKSVIVPQGPVDLQQGAQDYRRLCQGCHAAPGVQRSPVSKGLQPEPPELYREHDEPDLAQVFWVIKHGIKSTGMPSFGITYDDARLWPIAHFVEQLPKLSPEQYRAMAGTVMTNPEPPAATGETP